MAGFTAALSNILSVIMAVFLIPFSGLTSGIDAISKDVRTDYENENVVGLGAYYRSQGIATDGENYYFSGRTTLIKTKSDFRTVVSANYLAIPKDVYDEYNSQHIGGISYYNGKLYGGMEDSKVFEHPLICVFNCDTLELEKYYEMNEKSEDGGLAIRKGVPWVAVDPATGYLYCADQNKRPTKLFVFDVNNEMKKVKEIELPQLVYSIQGAEFYNGELYAATNDDTQAIYKINVETGVSEKVLDRNLTDKSEGEGMTINTIDGKPVIVAIDLGPLRINAFVRKYNIG